MKRADGDVASPTPGSRHHREGVAKRIERLDDAERVALENGG